MNLKYVFTLSTVYSVFIEVLLYVYPSFLNKEYKCIVGCYRFNFSCILQSRAMLTVQIRQRGGNCLSSVFLIKRS